MSEVYLNDDAREILSAVRAYYAADDDSAGQDEAVRRFEAVSGGVRWVDRPDWLRSESVLFTGTQSTVSPVPMDQWLDLGNRNYWICRACDPAFDRESFHLCRSLVGFCEAIGLHGSSYCLGVAFYTYHAGHWVCAIQQDDGGDEWLIIRDGVDFESLSAGAVCRGHGFAALVAYFDAVCHIEADTACALRSAWDVVPPETSERVSILVCAGAIK